MSFTDKELLDARKSVQGFCYKLTGSKHNGEDLCQRTFLKALEYKDSYVSRGKITAWLMTIARNLHYTDCRTRHRMVAIDPHVLESTSAGGPADAPLHKIHLAQVLEIMKRIPEDYAKSLLLAMQGHDYQEAADILGIKLGTYKSRLSRARSTLLEHLENPEAVAKTPANISKKQEIKADAGLSASGHPERPAIEKPVEVPSIVRARPFRIYNEAELSARLNIPRSKIHAALIKSGKDLPVHPVFSTHSQSYMVSARNMVDLCTVFQIETREAHPAHMTPSDASVRTGIDENTLRVYFDGLVRQKKRQGYATIGGKSAVSIVHAYDERAEAVVPMIPAVFSQALAKDIS